MAESSTPQIQNNMDKKEAKIAALRASLVGTWRLTGWKKASSNSNGESDVFGSSPTGYLNYDQDGRILVLALHGDRPSPSQSPPSEEEKIKLFDSMLAYAGTYTVQEDRVLHKLDASWNDIWTNTVQTRLISLKKNRLTYTTPVMIDPVDGKPCIFKVMFVRA